MAWMLIKTILNGNSTHLTEWQIDSASDISNPSTGAQAAAPGSIAYLVDGSKQYRKSNAGTWTEMVSTSGGGGTGGAAMIVTNLDSQTGMLDKTAGELYAASTTNPIVLYVDMGNAGEGVATLLSASVASGNYMFMFRFGGDEVVLQADSEDDYPAVYANNDPTPSGGESGINAN